MDKVEKKLTPRQKQRASKRRFEEHIRNGTNNRQPIHAKRIPKKNPRRPKKNLDLSEKTLPVALMDELKKLSVEHLPTPSNSTIMERRNTLSVTDFSRHVIIEKKVDKLISGGCVRAATPITRRRLTVQIKKRLPDYDASIDKKQPARMLFLSTLESITENHHEQQRLLAEKNAAIGTVK